MLKEKLKRQFTNIYNNLRKSENRRNKTDKEAGFTFVETLVVILIILILSSAVGFTAFRYIDRAKIAAARNQIESYSLALNGYLFDCKNYPSEEQGLNALWEKPILAPVPSGWDGPYVNKNISDDPWGTPYKYKVPGVNGLPFGITSYGADGREGGESKDEDINSWES